MKPSEAVRAIIGKRFGAFESRKGEMLRCVKSAHARVDVGASFVIHPPKTGNDPYLSEAIVGRVREHQAMLIWSRPTKDKSGLDVWALPPKVVLEMWERVQIPTRARDGSSWDTRMDDDEGKWYWRPCGKDRVELGIDVTEWHQVWRLTDSEEQQLRQLCMT